MPAKTKKRIRTPHILVPPTPERLAKMDGFVYRSATGPITARDAPLERMEARGIIDRRMYDAGVKYRIHWHQAGLQERYASLRLDGTFGGSPETITDATAHHRGVYEKAVQFLGVRRSNVVEEICCRDCGLLDVGRKLGYRDADEARAASKKLLVEGLEALADFWGILR